MFKRKNKPNYVKSLNGVEKCTECGLVFSRLEIATNKEAKRKILHNDRDFIIKTSKLPSDVSFLKLLLLCIFTGALGGHLFYVGRYVKGGILALNFIVIVLSVIFNSALIKIDNGLFIAALASICGLILLIWPYDLFMIIWKKFKVPVAIDLNSK